MALEGYRRVVVEARSANDPPFSIRLSKGDVNGRILRFVVWDGGDAVGADGLTCTFQLMQGSGLSCALDRVAGDTATFEAPVPMGNVDPGVHKGAIRVADASGNAVVTRLGTVIVERGVVDDGTDEMLDALTAFETRADVAIGAMQTATATAIASARSATATAMQAAATANAAADSANSAIDAALTERLPEAVADAMDGYAEGLSATVPDAAVVALVGEEWGTYAGGDVPASAIYEVVSEEWV